MKEIWRGLILNSEEKLDLLIAKIKEGNEELGPLLQELIGTKFWDLAETN